MTKTSKIWLIALMICITATYLSFNLARSSSQEAVDGYDYSQIESYDGVIVDIETDIGYTDGNVSYTDIVQLDNGEEVKVRMGRYGDYDYIGEEVTVYTDRYHETWAYSEESVAKVNTGEFLYCIPVIIFGTGVAMCGVGFLGSLSEKQTSSKKRDMSEKNIHNN